MQLEANLGHEGSCFAWLAKQAENSPKMGSPATLHAQALHQLFGAPVQEGCRPTAACLKEGHGAGESLTLPLAPSAWRGEGKEDPDP